MKGYKGFTKNMECQDKQYKVGETITHDGPIKLCSTGLHFCEHPLDVFGYYPPSESRFAAVEADGVDVEKSTDSKKVCNSIKVVAELSISAMVEAAVKFVFEKVDWSKAEEKTNGESGAASATGERGAASATGDRGAASATGENGAASATGQDGCAIALGIGGKALGVKGCWLTVAEWKLILNIWHRTDVQTRRVDGEIIKANTWYQLKNGNFVEEPTEGTNTH